MKTAIDFLVETLAENGILHSSDIEQAKEMEKQQIVEANDALFSGTAEQYYKETFKNNG